MTRVPLTICLALAWFFVANVLLSIGIAAVAASWRARRTRQADAPVPGGAALALRLLPAISAAAFAGGVFVPAFIVHEPATGPEPVGWVLCAAAAAALVLGLRAVRRGVTAGRTARALVDGWMPRAARIQLDGPAGTAIGAYVVEDCFPVVALVGICRPRLFIARQVIEALTPGELRVAVAHEMAHRRSWDNAKRLLLCWSPDLLGGSAAGRRLEHQWAVAAECAADRCAAGGSRARAIELAGALVKVARLAVAPMPQTPLFSTLHERGDVAERVSRLVTLSPRPVHPPHRRAALVAAGAAALLLPEAWPAVHALTEACVRLLP